MEIREMRRQLGVTQSEFASRYNIPFRTVQNWENGVRQPPAYLLELLENQIKLDLVNKRTITLPEYDPQKLDLPKRSDFLGAISWLRAVRDCLGEDVVFALDNALMCQGAFLGRSDEFLVWVYGNDSLTRYNGVVVLGNKICKLYVEEKNGLRFTNFNRTLSDSIANESILDMQGITEALSKQYYKNGENFDGIFVTPSCQERFETLAEEAIEYYGGQGD